MHDDPRNVVTQHNDNSRTGTYLAETHLAPGNVHSGSFGKLYEREVSGDIYAHPLYVHGVQTRHGVKNLIFVATSTNTVYAFDADEPNTHPRTGVIWKQKLDPVPGSRQAPTRILHLLVRADRGACRHRGHRAALDATRRDREQTRLSDVG